MVEQGKCWLKFRFGDRGKVYDKVIDDRASGFSMSSFFDAILAGYLGS